MLYYPLVEQARYQSLAQLSDETGIALTALQQAQVNATIEGSDFAVCESVALGDPPENARAVLQAHSDASVTQWVGLFGETS